MSEDSSTQNPSPDAEEAYARYLLEKRHGGERSVDDLCRSNPDLAGDLREIHSRWTRASGTSLAQRLKEEKGFDVEGSVSLEAQEDADREGSGSSSRILKRLLAQGSGGKRYDERGEIARGGMGSILKVWDEDLRRTLAMKVMLEAGEGDSSGSVRLARFLEEAQITGQLDHPGVVPVHEIGLDAAGRVYFTMQLVKGRDLKHIFELVLEEREDWTLTRAVGVMLRVCEAMAFAHEKGVIHRDLKPANVMVGRFGETYVMDWGLAKVLGRDDSHDVRLRERAAQSLTIVRTDRADSDSTPDSPIVTMDGDVVGTPCYMSPEQAKGQLEQIGPRSDVYAVGAMLYELLTGRAPYLLPGERVSPHTVLGLVLHGPPLRIEEVTRKVPSELVAICEKAMAREADARYASMLTMAEDLRAYLEDRVVAAYEAGSIAEFKKWIGRNKGTAGAMAAAGLAILLGLGAVAAVQTRANRDLVAAKGDVERARDDLLESHEALEQTNVDLASATERAVEKEREARLRGYSANVAAAAASLREFDVKEARRRLDLCDVGLRGWEWHRLRLETDSSLWEAQVQGGVMSLYPIADASFSPNGTRIAVITGAGELIFLDAATGETLEQIDHGSAASVLAWTPDGARVVTGSSDRRLRVWNVESGEMEREFRAHRSAVWTVDVSRDGTRILSGAGDKTVKVWDFATGELVTTLEGHTSAITSAAFDPAGARVVSGGKDRTVRIFDVETGAALHVLTGHGVQIGAVAFGPRGRLVASVSLELSAGAQEILQPEDSSIRIWDASTGALVKELRGHTNGVTDVSFSPNGQALASSSLDRTVRVWDIESGDSNALLGHTSRNIKSIDFNADGSRIVSAGGVGVRLWDPSVATGLTISGHPRTIVGVRSWDDGERALSASREGTIRVWDTTSGEVLHALRNEDIIVLDLAYAPLSGRLATAGGRSNFGFTQSNETGPFAYLWDVGTRTLLTPLVGHEQPVTAIAATLDGSLIATGSADKTVRTWDGRTGELLATLDGHEHVIGAVALHPHGESLVSTDTDGVRSWDLETGKSTVVFDEHVTFLRFDRSGEQLLAGRRKGTIQVLSAPDFEPVVELPDSLGGLNDAVFSPDGLRIASSSSMGTVRISDAASGEPLLTLRAPAGAVSSLAFTPDGRRLLGGFVDGRVHVWCIDPPQERSEARRVVSSVHAVVWPAVATAFEELVDPARVVARLGADRSLAPEERAAAVRLAGQIGGAPHQLEDEVWATVRDRFQTTQASEQALWKARYACEIEPDEEGPLRLLGMALYRLERYEEAKDALERSHALRVDRRRARPETAAFLAMTHHHLGDAEAARAHLELVRGLMRIAMLQTSQDSIAFLEEAEATVGPEPVR